MTARKLRVATEEDAKKAPPKSLAEALEGGSYLEILIAQRREMVRDVRDMTGPAKAALHRQIGLTSKEIAALQAEAAQEASEGGDIADDEAISAEAF